MPVKPRKIPMRMCVGCREMKPKKELLRVVRSPEGEVSLDAIGDDARQCTHCYGECGNLFRSPTGGFVQCEINDSLCDGKLVHRIPPLPINLI